MEKWMRALLLTVGMAVAAIVIASSTVDEGEVVTLISQNGSGAYYDTQLWIVDVDGRLYLRAGSPGAQWLARLREHPDVVLKRADQTLAFTALPKDDPQIRATVNERMAAKYGYADRLWGYVGRRGESVPVLLEPRPGP
jgi:hypothetical protein